jgi:hypothetical protein
MFTTILQWSGRHPGDRVPYMREIQSVTENVIRFNGYFYMDNTELPVERILYTTEGCYAVEILEKREVEDTSEYGPMEDDDGSTCSVCFFPTAIIELQYRIVDPLFNVSQTQ